jgi:cystathionine beta-lyase
MNEFSFNDFTERRGTNAIKTDLAAIRGKPEDVLPLWVADMDFPTAPCILDALNKKVSHGIFGYSCTDEKYFSALKNWMKTRHDFEIQRNWIVNTPGVVFAISCAIRAFTSEGDGVLIMTPVYYPFKNMIELNGRRTVENSLIEKNGHYEIDFADFEKKIESDGVKLFILCSPHNPVGRVWKKSELQKISEICIKHNVIIFADEIHNDFTFGENVHTVFSTISKEAAWNCVVSTSASKTFNLAGLQFSTNFIQNPVLKKKFRDEKDKTGYDEPNIMGLVATVAAYENGGIWLDALKIHLAENLNFVRKFIAEKMNRVRLVEPEGTFLLWLDFSAYGLSDEELDHTIVQKAKVWLDRGTMFGTEGKNFQRLNIATPQKTLQEALEKIRSALE